MAPVASALPGGGLARGGTTRAETAVGGSAVCAACGGGSVLPGDVYCTACGTSQPRAGALPDPESQAREYLDELLDDLRRATLGDYEVLGLLGRGGMAVVYLGHEIALDRKVAIKVMAPSLMVDPGMIERFIHEARIMATLDHAHIVTIHAIRAVDRLYFFVMQFVEGCPVSDLLQAGPLPIPIVQAVVRQVGEALAYAHRHRVIHRDIKPGNIILDVNGHAVVTDFGIAKVAEAPSYTMTGGTIGTPAYMSPEQCTGAVLTGASDQYSLGIVAYEMLTGATPFTGSALVLQMAHIGTPPPSIRERRPDCPPELEAAIFRMLAKLPDERWSTLAAAIEAVGGGALHEEDPLQTALRNRIVQSVHAFTPTPISPTPLRRRRRPAATPAGEEQRAEIPPAEIPPVVEGAAVAKRKRPTTVLILIALVAVVATGLGIRAAFRPAATPLPVTSDSALATPAPVVIDSSPPLAQAPTATPPSATPSPPVVARILLAPGQAHLTSGETLSLRASLRDPSNAVVANQSIAWSSDNGTVASVTAAGLVTALGAGTTTIRASSGSASARASIVVSAPAPPAPTPVVPVLARVMLTPVAARLSEGTKATFSAGLLSTDNRSMAGDVTWSVEDATVAALDASGATATVTGKRAGSTRIWATSDGVRGEATVTVVAASPAPAVNQDALRIKEAATVIEAWRQAINDRDLARLQELQPSMPSERADQWKDLFSSRGAEGVKSLTAAVTMNDIQVTGETVTAHYQLLLRFTPGGGQPQESRQRVDAILEEVGGRWRIRSLAFTSLPP